MTRVILHAPSGAQEYEPMEIAPTQVAAHLEFNGKPYTLAGVQDGVAHYEAAWTPSS